MKKKILILMVLGLVLSLNVALAKNDKCTTIQSGELLASDGTVITTGYDQWGYNYQAHIFNGGYCDAYRDAAWCQDYKDVNLIMKWNDAWLANKDCDGDGLLDRHYGHDSYIGSGAWITNHMSGEYEKYGYNWDVSGDWLLDFDGGDDNRQFVNLVQDEEGNVEGEFWYLSGSDWLLGGTLEGEVTGDELYLYYERPAPLTYTGTFYGTIGENVITDGTFTDSSGNNLTWTAVGNSVEVDEMCKWNYFTKIVAVPEDAYSEDGIWYNAEGIEIGPKIWGQFATIQEVENDPCAGLNGVQYHSPVRAGLGNW